MMLLLLEEHQTLQLLIDHSSECNADCADHVVEIHYTTPHPLNTTMTLCYCTLSPLIRDFFNDLFCGQTFATQGDFFFEDQLSRTLANTTTLRGAISATQNLSH
mmetsp:Transcript_2726/g.10479  ORF Transcript_2726/g.10479 Transcript_2726/m.10479 type:complete len:104 (+) Transcript_2726:1917-2228(+)